MKTFNVPLKWKDIGEKIFIGNDNYSINSVILTSHNKYTYFLNNKILNKMKGCTKTYSSIDCATNKGVDKSDSNIYINFPTEILNSIRESLPSHELH